MPRSRTPRVAVRRRQVLPAWVRRLDAAAGRRINARHAHPVADRGYARLSHAADRGRLWFALAALLFVFGRRRAALRGLASLTAASILANLVGKKVFGGNRPLLKDIPVGRRLKKTPTSGSFPSGHSASAAAFATGAALESPGASSLVAPLALGVAYSRLHTGAHWLSDVVGGAALGVAVAGLGKLLVPAPPRPAGGRMGGTDIDLPALPDGAGVFIVANPSSGAKPLRADPLPLIRERLPRARVHELEPHDDLAAVIAEAVEAGRPVVLGVCGGDGTVAAVAQLAREHGLPLLALPGGTFNHFARSAGVETIDAGIDAVVAGHGVRVDVAELVVGDDTPITVLNAASVGIYPDFVAEREKHEKRLGKWVAGVVAAIRVLWGAHPVSVTINGRPARVWSLFVGVNRNRTATVAPMQRMRLDDGVLDLRILRARSRLHAAGSLAFGHRRARAGSLIRRPSAFESTEETAVAVAVRPREGQAPGFAHDGEVWQEPSGGSAPAGGYESTLRIVPLGLRVYSPAPASPA